MLAKKDAVVAQIVKLQRQIKPSKKNRWPVSFVPLSSFCVADVRTYSERHAVLETMIATVRMKTTWVCRSSKGMYALPFLYIRI